MAFGLAHGVCTTVALGADGPIEYPKAKKVAVTDTYHGVEVPDPYRWLEEEPNDSPEVRAWIEAENKVTNRYLEGVSQRRWIQKRLRDLWNYERWGVPKKWGDRYFVTKNDGLQNQDVLFYMDSAFGVPKELLDPNKLSSAGTVSLRAWDVTDDGKLLAYALETSGSDWREIKVRDVESGKDLPDVIRWVKFSWPSWTKDGKGFFYSRYDEPQPGTELRASNYFNKLYYHKLGTPQSQDQLIYEREDQKEWGFSGEVTEDGRYLVISVSRGTERKNMVFYKDLQEENSPIVELIQSFDAKYEFIDNEGSVFWFYTDLWAPRGRVIRIDLAVPERGRWGEVIPQVTASLRSVSRVGDKFVAQYLKDAYAQVAIFTMEGRFERKLDFPMMGSAGGFRGRKGNNETFYMFTSFTQPHTIYRYDVATGETEAFRRPLLGFRQDDFMVEQNMVPAKDGTKVPLFVTRKKRSFEHNGQNPTLLYGYGGFDIPVTPFFRVENAVWLEMGGVYAVANIRGGGEYGTEWHEAGMKLKKQNCFDDFMASAEWLITNRYTSSPQLAITGGSNGGLLVGACITQRPELFGAALPAVGVLDMLRFHKFTIGWAWVSDYGSPENADEFKALFAYSPYHNLKPGTAYPPTLITTGDHDDRVVPAHSFKFAARLQEVQSGPAPVLIRIETEAGHGAGKPVSKQLEEVADRLSFLAQTMGIKVPQ